VTTGAPSRPRPDWRLWRQIPTAKVWEAVALSLDIDPTTVRRVDLKAANAALALRGDKIGLMAKQQALLWSGPTSRFDESEEFNERLEVTVRNEERLPNVAEAPDHPADRMVGLAQFAAMAGALQWEVPRELAQLPKPVQDPQLLDMRQAYDQLRAETGKEPSRRKVAERANYDRDTVNKRWNEVVSDGPDRNQPKPAKTRQ
jgi:hypothetical protein